MVTIVTIFLKTKTGKKVKRIRNIAKLANAHMSRTQGVCHVIHIFFGSSLGKVGINVPRCIIVGYVKQILGRRWPFCFPPHPLAALKKPILNRVKKKAKN